MPEISVHKRKEKLDNNEDIIFKDVKESKLTINLW